MRNEKGITLIALIIYIILMTFVVAGVTAITTSFYGNLNEMDKTSESAVAFSKFNMYFINDIKSENVKIANSGTNYIELSFGNKPAVKYSVQNGTLYRDKIKICDKIKDFKIELNGASNTDMAEPMSIEDNKSISTRGLISSGLKPTSAPIITIYLKIDNYEKTTTYVLEPKNDKNGSVVIRLN